MVLTGESILARALGVRGINNMWVYYTFLPLTTALVLWALSHWQGGSTARLAFRVAIPLVVVVSAVLTFTMEDTRTFSLVAGPFHGIVLLLAALWTFLALSVRTEGPFVRHDWFWVAGGLTLYAGTTAAVQPLGWYFLAERPDLVRAVWSLAGAAAVLAFAAIAGGLLCQDIPSSGGSLSQRSSRSSSWSADSRSP